MKKPLTPCQRLRVSLEASRAELVKACERAEVNQRRAQTAESQLEQAERKCEKLSTENDGLVRQLEEAQGALTLGASELRKAATRTERRLIQDVELYARLASGDVPWLIKDFNVLYRAALRLFDEIDGAFGGSAERARRDLGRQLERLKPAFADTEEARELARPSEETPP